MLNDEEKKEERKRRGEEERKKRKIGVRNRESGVIWSVVNGQW
jgi:hypothetical protein